MIGGDGLLTGPEAIIPLLMLFPLAATIRQAWPGTPQCAGMASNAVSGSGWLVPLIFIVPTCIGLMIAGELSPLPQRAFAEVVASHGPALGLAAALAVITSELWLVLVPSMIALRFGGAARHEALRGLVLLNLLLGSSFLAILLLLRH